MSGQSGFQLQGSAPEAYERYIVPAFLRVWATNLVERAALVAGERVLDVACGTGLVAREAAKALGDAASVEGVDINAGMIASARRIAREQGVDAITWHQGDVVSLPFPDASFDVALCPLVSASSGRHPQGSRSGGGVRRGRVGASLSPGTRGQVGRDGRFCTQSRR